MLPDSYLVLRNGRLIHESYYHGYDKDTAHVIHSATKSVVSALVGIAIGDGYITGVDQKVQNFFPDVALTEDLQYKKEMTVEHLLTMTSGISGDKVWDELSASENIGDALFALPQKKMPGEAFQYEGSATHLLAILVSRATGQPLYEYAKEKLFDPLGMDSVFWGTDAQGNYNGGTDISMTPRDMMRFGYRSINLAFRTQHSSQRHRLANFFPGKAFFTFQLLHDFLAARVIQLSFLICC